MAMAKKGARIITVDGVLYRWRIRGRPTYCQGNSWSNLSVAIEPVIEAGGVTTLVVDTSAPHPSNWVEKAQVSVTPATVATYIRQALKQGWKPAQHGATFTLVGDESLILQEES